METKLETLRFHLRELTIQDASVKYLSWFSEQTTSEYITYKNEDLKSLQNYIFEKDQDPNCWFYGIFTKKNQEHIGNLKYERHPNHEHVATLGILIGDESFQGKGVASEVIHASTDFLKKNTNIKRINLGVAKDNIAAIKAYEKIGFEHTDNGYFDFPETSIEMILIL
ncbi:GNAT family N-acetyltransferase [Pseudoalteromonas sp. C2R02]|uniref:GNAT family N-acetyltransferase n=1 Tax=Pseudoalteromonas sp. C2R02 TaxID=2841565 RepID=UPI001C08F667|nr:GNAT family N-acetyltransferase [Pseudoalteromonas sp. C2R02]MBU2968999.1 GNAT family N-acetyltransferase [Pseudoalteromonas sp. C2R02]